MLTQNPFASVSNLFPGFESFTPVSAQDAVKPLMDNLMAWGALVQTQSQETQAAIAHAAEPLQSPRDPLTTLNAMWAASHNVFALNAKHLQEVVELSAEQFKAGITASNASVKKRH